MELKPSCICAWQIMLTTRPTEQVNQPWVESLRGRAGGSCPASQKKDFPFPAQPTPPSGKNRSGARGRGWGPRTITIRTTTLKNDPPTEVEIYPPSLSWMVGPKKERIVKREPSCVVLWFIACSRMPACQPASSDRHDAYHY